MKNKTAFTLMEIVVAMGVIAILISAAMVSTQAVRQSNRDTRRVADIAELKGALHDYFEVFGDYPQTGTITAGQKFAAYNPLTTSTMVFLAKVPFNPLPVDGSCPNVSTYAYARIAEGPDYTLSFCLGDRVGDWGAGSNSASSDEDTTCIPDCVMSCGGGSNGCAGTCTTSTCSLGYTCYNDHCIKN